MTGTEVQKHIVVLARSLGWTVRVMDQRNSRGVLRAQSKDQRGWPDLAMLRDTRLLWVECKSRGEKLRPDQVDRNAQLAAAGQGVFVVSEDTLTAFISMIA